MSGVYKPESCDFGVFLGFIRRVSDILGASLDLLDGNWLLLMLCAGQELFRILRDESGRVRSGRVGSGHPDRPDPRKVTRAVKVVTGTAACCCKHRTHVLAFVGRIGGGFDVAVIGPESVFACCRSF